METKLTNTEKAVLEFINTHRQEAENMSVRMLADRTHVSNATIMRLAQKLGYSGYKDMQKKILKHNEADKYTSRDVDFISPFSKDNTAADVVTHMGRLFHAGTDALLAEIWPQDIQAFSEYLYHADHIFIFASGETRICCEAFSASLSKLSIYPVNTADATVPLMAANAGPKDCGLIVSYRGSSDYMKDISELKKNHCRVLAITANRESPVAGNADKVILLPDHEDKSNIFVNFYSQHAVTFVLNCIFTMMRIKKESLEQS